MIKLRWLAAALLLGGAVPGVAADKAPVENPQYSELLTYGHVLLLKGQPADAIARYFDPIIAAYDKQYGGSKDQVYGARTTAETLFYMLLAASQKRSAIAISSVWGDALFAKAFALVDLARRDEARPLLERALVLSPYNSRYLSELGNLSQSDKDWPKALELFTRAEQATAYSPDPSKTSELTRAWRGQGYVLTELGRYDESEALYRKCLALDPNDTGAQRELRYVRGLRPKHLPATS